MNLRMWLAAAALVAACSSKKSEPEKAPRGSAALPVPVPVPAVAVDAAVAVETKPSPPSWPAAQPPGPLYIAFGNHAPLMIDVDGSAKKLSVPASVHHLDEASDGQVFASAWSPSSILIYRLDGASAKALPSLSTRGVGAARGAAVDARGDDVVVAFSDTQGTAVRIARLAGGKWSIEPADVKVGSVVAIALGTGDELWLAGSSGAAVRRGGTWTSYDCPDRASCISGGLGKVGDQVIVQERDRSIWQDYEVRGDKLELRTDGPAVMWSSSGFGRNGTQFSATNWEPHVEYRNKAIMSTGFSIPWRAEEVSVLDGAQRAWTFGDRGLAVIDLKTETTTRYPQRTFGVDASDITDFAVVRGGPALPATPEPRIAKTVSISVRVNGKLPTTNNGVAVCPRGSTSDAEPCAHSTPGFKANTDAKGNFTLTDVPEGLYDLALLGRTSDGKVMWAVANQAMDIKPGANVRVPVSVSLTEYRSYMP